MRPPAWPLAHWEDHIPAHTEGKVTVEKAEDGTYHMGAGSTTEDRPSYHTKYTAARKWREHNTQLVF